MLKNNIFGIVMVILLILTFGVGYWVGKGSNQAPVGKADPRTTEQSSAKQAEETPVAKAPASDEPQSSQETPSPEIAPEVAAPAATSTPAGHTFYGTAAPFDEANVQSKQGGAITMLKAEEGDSVRQGEVIVRFDDSDIQLQLQQAISSKNAALQQVRQAESDFNTVQTNVDRNQQLFDDGMISQQQMDDINNQLESARAALNSAKESVTQADAQIDITNNSLKDFQVDAPISGLIDVKKYNPGEVYQAGGIIYHIINIERVYAEVEIPETYLTKVREKMEVAVVFDALGDHKFSGIVDRILPSGAADNRNFTAKVLVENPEHVIKPGMFARVEVVLKDSPSTP